MNLNPNKSGYLSTILLLVMVVNAAAKFDDTSQQQNIHSQRGNPKYIETDQSFYGDRHQNILKLSESTGSICRRALKRYETATESVKSNTEAQETNSKINEAPDNNAHSSSAKRLRGDDLGGEAAEADESARGALREGDDRWRCSSQSNGVVLDHSHCRVILRFESACPLEHLSDTPRPFSNGEGMVVVQAPSVGRSTSERREDISLYYAMSTSRPMQLWIETSRPDTIKTNFDRRETRHCYVIQIPVLDGWQNKYFQISNLNRNLAHNVWVTHGCDTIMSSLKDATAHLEQKQFGRLPTSTPLKKYEPEPALAEFWNRFQTAEDAPTAASIDESVVWRTRRGTNECQTCLKSILLTHNYNASTGFLSLHISKDCVNICCDNCNVKVDFFIVPKLNKSSCEEYEIQNMLQVTNLISQWEGTVTPTSGVDIAVTQGCYVSAIMMGRDRIWNSVIWLQAFDDDALKWKTVFYLEPSPNERKMEVRWRRPPFPHNFSRYDLQLWYQPLPEEALSCNGLTSRDEAGVHLVMPTPAIPVDQPFGVFKGLDPGWYCARLFATDPRCPLWGCGVRVSPSVYLKPPDGVPVEPSLLPPPNESGWAGLAWAVGAVLLVGAVLAVAALLLLRRGRRPAPSVVVSNGVYSRVSSAAPAEPVLMVWTSAGDAGVARAVAALKRVLAHHFTVWDYLDLMSLPVHEHQSFEADAHSWLLKTVRRPGVRVVLVENSKAIQQMTSEENGNPDLANETTVLHSTLLEPLLYKFVIRQTRSDAQLSNAYAKLFVVRLSRHPAECGAPPLGIVPTRVYVLPAHLLQLTAALAESGKEQSRDACPPALLSELSERCSALC